MTKSFPSQNYSENLRDWNVSKFSIQSTSDAMQTSLQEGKFKEQNKQIIYSIESRLKEKEKKPSHDFFHSFFDFFFSSFSSALLAWLIIYAERSSEL